MKKCPKCGAELPDEAMFCNECGEKVEAPAATQPTPEAATPAPKADAPAPEAATPAPKADAPAPANANTNTADAVNAAPVNNATLEAAQQKAKNSSIGIIAVAAVALLIVIILIIAIAGGGGYKTPIKKLVNNINNGNSNIESYLSYVAPSFVSDLYSDIYGIVKSADKDVIKDYDEELADAFEDFFDELKDEYGDDYKLTVEFRDAERLDSRDLKDIREIYEDLYDMIDGNIDYKDDDLYDDLIDELDDSYDLDLSKQSNKLQKAVVNFMDNLEDFKIQDGYEVKLRVEISGDEGSDKQTITINVLKVNGKWFIDPNSLIEAATGRSISSSISSLMWYLY